MWSFNIYGIYKTQQSLVQIHLLYMNVHQLTISKHIEDESTHEMMLCRSRPTLPSNGEIYYTMEKQYNAGFSFKDGSLNTCKFNDTFP